MTIKGLGWSRNKCLVMRAATGFSSGLLKSSKRGLKTALNANPKSLVHMMACRSTWYQGGSHFSLMKTWGENHFIRLESLSSNRKCCSHIYYVCIYVYIMYVCLYMHIGPPSSFSLLSLLLMCWNWTQQVGSGTYRLASSLRDCSCWGEIIPLI